MFVAKRIVSTTLVLRITQKVMVLEALMLQMTKLFKNGLEKIQKFVETRSWVGYSREQGKNFTGWYRNKNIASDQMHFSSWKQDIFLAQNRESIVAMVLRCKKLLLRKIQKGEIQDEIINNNLLKETEIKVIKMMLAKKIYCRN